VILKLNLNYSIIKKAFNSFKLIECSKLVDKISLKQCPFKFLAALLVFCWLKQEGSMLRIERNDVYIKRIPIQQQQQAIN